MVVDFFLLQVWYNLRYIRMVFVDCRTEDVNGSVFASTVFNDFENVGRLTRFLLCHEKDGAVQLREEFASAKLCDVNRRHIDRLDLLFVDLP